MNTQNKTIHFTELIHGTDYNPEQWLDSPEILEKDVALMKLSKVNCVSVGIFSWSQFEPQENKFDFAWFDEIIARLHKNDIKVILATPSGARPAWLAQKYPEVLRVSGTRQRNLYGERHNHCYTSPIYRQKVAIINEKLAERYAKHPAVILWHISNELGGDCHCDLCQKAFREWLKTRYKTLEALNKVWWTKFWSHTYTDWEQIESPAPNGETNLHALQLDWKRFTTYQTIEFVKAEIEPLKKYNPELPITTNFMYYYDGLDYFKFKEIVDIVSWDNYPLWHAKDNERIALKTAFWHDMMRSIKNQPFLLMESTPSQTNWQGVSKLKRPGMHILSSMQAVAHGSDSVQYFQWRKSRGASEKFHGAVVDHYGEADTRVFKEVMQLGQDLQDIKEVRGSTTAAEVAIVYDWENKWAVEESQGPRNSGLSYIDAILDHYTPLWKSGVAVDAVDMACEISQYKVIIAPMLYMLRAGFGEKLHQFVKNGGTLVTTYWSGIVDENDLCFLGGFPGQIGEIVGIWAEEIDSISDEDFNGVRIKNKVYGEVDKTYKATELCEIIHTRGAEVIAEYTDDFYKGYPAVTVNKYGEGKAYYIASKNDSAFFKDFYNNIIDSENLYRPIKDTLPEGVTVNERRQGGKKYLFIQNYSKESRTISVEYPESMEITLKPFGVEVIKQELQNESIK